MGYLDERPPVGQRRKLSQWLKQTTKETLGRLLLLLRPDLRKKLETRDLDRYRHHHREDTLAERLALEALLARRRTKSAHEEMSRAHQAYWSNDAIVEHHASLTRRFSEAFLGRHFPLVQALDTVVAGGRYQTLCEIGCASGLVLDYCAKSWPTLRTLIGLDLSAKQIELNRANYTDNRLQFVAADATLWIPEHVAPKTVVLTYNGVLEYFTEPALEALLRELAKRAPLAIAMVEPVAFDYDLVEETNSRLFGGEMSFSHNYPRALERAGFRVQWQHELPRGRYLMMIATIGDDQAYDFSSPRPN